jgi:hypothetical protein
LDLEKGLVTDLGADTTLPKATKSLVLISVPEIPGHLPQTAGSHPTKQQRTTRPEQACETSGEISEAMNAVQGAEV